VPEFSGICVPPLDGDLPHADAAGRWRAMEAIIKQTMLKT